MLCLSIRRHWEQQACFQFLMEGFTGSNHISDTNCHNMTMTIRKYRRILRKTSLMKTQSGLAVIDISTLKNTEEGTEKLQEPEVQDICCKIVSSKHNSETAPMKYQQHGLNKI